MEVIFTIVGLIIAVKIVGGILGWLGSLGSGGSTSYSPGTPASSPIPPLSVRVRKTTKNIEGERFPTLTVEMKGQMPGPIYGTAPVEFFLHLFDTEKHEEGFEPVVFSSLEVFQEESSPAFQFRMGPEEMSGMNYFSDWVELVEIPIVCLGFPWKGRRKIKLRFLALLADRTVEPAMFEFGGHSRGSDTLFGASEATFTHEVTESGWLDENKNRPKVWASTIELAMHLASVDGSLDKSEGEIIKSWAKDVISSAPSGKSGKTKKELNAAIEKSYGRASRGETFLAAPCRSLKELATEQQKYDALKLCVEVMSADGKADDSEMKELDRIVGLLGLDPAQYRKMLDPHLTRVEMDVGDAVGGDRKSLLGIREGMSKEEIRKLLTDANRNWNSRVTSSDPEIRRRAEEMLKLIAELREDLL